MLPHGSVVHHDQQVGFDSPLSRLLVYDPVLHPDVLGPHPDSLFHYGEDVLRAAEDVYYSVALPSLRAPVLPILCLTS